MYDKHQQKKNSIYTMIVILFEKVLCADSYSNNVDDINYEFYNFLGGVKMQSIRILEMPDCKMVSSGKGMFGEEKFNRFDEWLSSQKRSLFPKDFLLGEEDGFTWLYLFEDGMSVPAEFEIVDFKGGLYAVATDIDQKTDTELMNTEVNQFLKENGFERDTLRKDLGNIITSYAAQEIMGYEQMDYYFPIKAKK